MVFLHSDETSSVLEGGCKGGGGERRDPNIDDPEGVHIEIECS